MKQKQKVGDNIIYLGIKQVFIVNYKILKIVISIIHIFILMHKPNYKNMGGKILLINSSYN